MCWRKAFSLHGRRSASTRCRARSSAFGMRNQCVRCLRFLAVRVQLLRELADQRAQFRAGEIERQDMRVIGGEHRRIALAGRRADPDHRHRVARFPLA